MDLCHPQIAAVLDQAEARMHPMLNAVKRGTLILPQPQDNAVRLMDLLDDYCAQLKANDERSDSTWLDILRVAQKWEEQEDDSANLAKVLETGRPVLLLLSLAKVRAVLSAEEVAMVEKWGDAMGEAS